MRTMNRALGALAALALAGCGDSLGVTNYNNPDIERVFATPAGVESFVAGLGPLLNNPQRATESVNTQAKVFSGESFASVANFGMAARAQIPRSPINNELGNDQQNGNQTNFFSFNRLARNASSALQALDMRLAEGAPFATASERRVRAFGYLIIGQALGNLALGYDSAAIITPSSEPVTPTSPPTPLSGYMEVAQTALDMLDSAIAWAPGMTPLPVTWLQRPASATTDAAHLIRLANSYKARIRAGVARDPAERAAVDWARVRDEAAAGITATHYVQIGGGNGWNAVFDVQQSYVAGGWHSVSYLYIGVSDTAGGFANWLLAPINDRRAFLIHSPDRRWPQGATRAAQQLPANRVSNLVPASYTCVGHPDGGDCIKFIVNRNDGNDIVLPSWGESFYDHRRWGPVQTSSATGPYADIDIGEMLMLRAEAHIRLGQHALAEPLIDALRLPNGLSSVAGLGAAGTVPDEGGAGTCVPRVPTGVGANTACGTLLEAMKYEKRMQTQMTGYMVWFADSRGWGDLPAGTPVSWPVPYQEYQARQVFTFPAGARVAGASTYGY